MRDMIANEQEANVNVDRCLSLVRKYTDIRKLTEEISGSSPRRATSTRRSRSTANACSASGSCGLAPGVHAANAEQQEKTV
ncbi:MAG: DUF4368 domain-containing protein [Clostridia bacterium]|nr:DUF4368 domain-containing protein [Clostridia bacterium]